MEYLLKLYNGKINNWNNINSIIDAQNFININNINNRELFTKTLVVYLINVIEIIG